MRKDNDEVYVRPNLGPRSNTTWLYERGSTRWRRMRREGDNHDIPEREGWTRERVLLDRHPITKKPLAAGLQWWVRETKL